jgi:GNAT superfamily N-acetyltransferase
MLPRAVEQFEEWFQAPLPEKSSDPRFEVRPANPTEFERLYDLVDEVFGVERPRAVFDWLYRDNPAGVAHCWVVEEKATGRLVCQNAFWPWPLAHGLEPRLGYLVGDSVVAPDWQRQGIAKVRHEVQNRHPVHATRMGLGWPNEKTQARLRKRDRAHELLGPLLEGVFRVSGGPRRAWRRLLDATGNRGLCVEEVTRFDSRFDAPTQHTMAWRGFWCPHDAEFLNWRYFAHPTRSYRALAALDGDDPVGYCVLRSEGRTALLMEFAAPEAGTTPRLLLERALEAAREAGCRQLAFYAPPGWRHWPSFRSAGFAERRSDRTLTVRGTGDPDTYRIEDWQILPGDCDDA